MKTALANSQGELVIPALITGTFSKPRFEPDVQQLAQMKLKGPVPNLNNPASVAGSLLNALGGPKNPAEGQQQAQQPNQQQQNPVQQFLGMFGKKKQQNAQPPKERSRPPGGRQEGSSYDCRGTLLSRTPVEPSESPL